MQPVTAARARRPRLTAVSVTETADYCVMIKVYRLTKKTRPKNQLKTRLKNQLRFPTLRKSQKIGSLDMSQNQN